MYVFNDIHSTGFDPTILLFILPSSWFGIIGFRHISSKIVASSGRITGYQP